MIVIDSDAIGDTAFWAICRTASGLRSLDMRLTRELREASAGRARARLGRWRNWATKGLTPTPLELLVNQFFTIVPRGGDLEPPRSQLILLRPAPGVDLSTSFDDPENTFLVEFGGLAIYNGSRSFFLGVSFAASIAGTSGLGVMAHLGEHVQGGVVWRKIDGSHDPRIIASLDLFSLLGSGANLGGLIPTLVR